MSSNRRAILAGLAGLPFATVVSPSSASASVDPFIHYGADIIALHAAMEGRDDEVCDPLMDAWGAIDAKAMAEQPTTPAGAVGALEYARREFVQFYVEPHDDGMNGGARLILHLLDGAISVLRQAAEGGARG